MTDAKSDAHKERDKKFGEFEVVDQDWRLTHLHVVDVDPNAAAAAKARRLTTGRFTVRGYGWSPNSKTIAFDHRVDPNPPNGHTADISVVTVADGSVRKLGTRAGGIPGRCGRPTANRSLSQLRRSFELQELTHPRRLGGRRAVEDR